jgi:rhodanese-related sulfurtransferase
MHSMDLEITVDQAKALLAAEPAPLLLDVREQWEFDTAHIDIAKEGGAKLIPMAEVPARAFQELDEEEPILVLCHHGARSLSVAAWLRNQGFTQAQSIAGGIEQWSRQIDPSVPRY